MSLRDMLMNARCRLITIEPWYGTMASLMKWIPDRHNTPTMGVRMVRGGEVEAVYNPDFCVKLTVEELMAVVKHEIEHIVRLHITRSGQDREHLVWNVSADMVCNGKERNPRIDNLPKNGVKMLDDMNEDITTEEAYDWLQKKRVKIQITCPMCGGSGKTGGDGGDGGDSKQGKDKGKGKDGQGKGQGNCPMCNGEGSQSHGGDGGAGKVTIEGTWIDDHNIWKGSTVSKDEARQIVKDMADQATQKACGNAPGHLAEVLKRLEKPIVNWKYEFRQIVGRKAGGKRRTFARRSRRHNHFGIPGKSSHASVPLTICVDTSGSMSSKDLERVFTEVESMSQRFKITVIQFDHQVQGDPQKYHRGDWKKIKILGRGGTSFINLVEWMKENKQVGDVNIILTDGYAPWPNEEDFYVIWAIVNEEVKAPWGKTIAVVQH
jgi:predicted metal-dependent peptidase